MHALTLQRGKIWLGRVVFGSLLVALPACHIPGQRSADGGAQLPGTFNSSSAAISLAPVPATPTEPLACLPPTQEFYTDPVLLELINQARAGNQELKILSEEIEIASNEVSVRRGAILPSVGLEAGGGLDRNSAFMPLGAAERQLTDGRGREFPDPVPRVRLGAALNWQVDIWRELRNARDAASARLTAVVERRNSFSTELVADVAEHYYRLLALDSRLAVLDQTIKLQEESLKVATAFKAAGRGTELAVQRFQAEVKKNESEKLVVRQEVVEAENRLNFLLGRFPQTIDRPKSPFVDVVLNPPLVGQPVQLLQNRPDIRRAERELTAAGLDIEVARVRFYPRLDITANVGWEAFNPRYLFDPGSFIAGAAGGFVAPFINRAAIKADYQNANARQLQAVYNYQRVVLDAFAEVVTRMTAAENYRQSVELKKQQVAALVASVDTANKLFQNARAEYIEVLFAQRDMLEARVDLINTKRQQLSAVISAYQALGGGYVFVDPVTPLPDNKR